MSDILEFTGTVDKIKEVQTFSSGFSKQEIRITEIDGKYPQSIPFEFIKDKIDLLSNITLGAVVRVCYNLRGSEWKDRDFVSLQAWKLELVKAAPIGGDPSDIEENVPQSTPSSSNFDDLEESPF